MVAGMQNPSASEGQGSISELTDGEYKLLCGFLTGEYDASVFMLIDYLYRTIKPQLLDNVDGIIMKKIQGCFSFKFNARAAIEFCKHPLPWDANLKKRAVYSLFHSLKSEALAEIDDFIFSEIKRMFPVVPPTSNNAIPIGEVNMGEMDGGHAEDILVDGTEEAAVPLDGGHAEDTVMDGPEEAVPMDGDFLEINDLESLLSDKKDE